MPEPVTLSADEQAVVAAWWHQRIYFDAVPARRWEVVPDLVATPGMTEAAAFALLMSAQTADDSVAYFAADGIDPDGQWITITHQHVHTDKSGKIDAGGAPHVRKLMGQETIGDKVRGAVGKVKKWGKKVGKAVNGAEDRLNNAVEKGSKKALDFIKDKGAKGYAKGKELAKKYGPIAKEKLKDGAAKGAALAAKYGKKGAVAAGKAAYKGAGAVGKGVIKHGGAAASRIGSAIKSGLSALWAKLKSKVVGPPKSVREKIADVKDKIKNKKLEGKLDRLNQHLERLSGKGGSAPAPAKAEKSKDVTAAPPKSGSGGGSGGGGGGFHERMKAAKAAKNAKKGGGNGRVTKPGTKAPPKDDDDEASRMPWDKAKT